MLGCHCWVPLLGCHALLGAIAWCHCWVPLLGAMLGCHCWVPLLGCHALLGAIAWCHCWVPFLGAIAGVPLLGAIARKNWPECYTVLPCTFLYIDNSQIGLCYLGIFGVYAGIIFLQEPPECRFCSFLFCITASRDTWNSLPSRLFKAPIAPRVLINSHCDLNDVNLNESHKSETPRLVFDLHGKAAKAGPGATASNSKSHMNWHEDGICLYLYDL